jgi:hypothetical protein
MIKFLNKENNITEYAFNINFNIFNHLNAIIMVFFIAIYIIIGALIIVNLSDADKLISDDKKNTYKNIYEILNAILYINNERDVVFEYENENIKNNKTFDKQLENNIGIVQNISILSDLKRIKNSAYDSLDFLKFFMLNKTSKYNLEFFNNIYVIIRGKDYYEKIYIKDYDKDNIVYRRLNTLIYKVIQKKSSLNRDIFTNIEKSKNLSSLNINNINEYINIIDNIDNKNYVPNVSDNIVDVAKDAIKDKDDKSIKEKLDIFDLLLNDIDIIINPDKYKKVKKDIYIDKLKKYLYTNKILFFTYLALILLFVLILLHKAFIIINSQLYYIFLIILFSVVISIAYLSNLYK